MSQRSEGQRIGAMGQRLVELLVEKTNLWISRRQDEDFGIDLEVELAETGVRGEILKLQIKSTEKPEVDLDRVRVVLDTKYLRLANSYRVPLIFVLADTSTEQVWYIWLQGWLVEQRRLGETLAANQQHVTILIPRANTLCAGLNGPLKDIARWAHEHQVVLSLTDTLRTAIAARHEQVLMSVAELIGTVDATYRDFPLEQLIDTVVEMSAQQRVAAELPQLRRFIAIIARKCGTNISKENVLRMVMPGAGVSRVGLDGLGALYDAHAEHIGAMNLPTAFEKAGHLAASYYCQLREKHPGVLSDKLALGDYDYRVGSYSLAIEDKGSFLNAWANRGESAYLDYLVPAGLEPDGRDGDKA